jgi:hypothetical protein
MLLFNFKYLLLNCTVRFWNNFIFVGILTYYSEHEQDTSSCLVSFSISCFVASVVGGKGTEGVISLLMLSFFSSFLVRFKFFFLVMFFFLFGTFFLNSSMSAA